MINTQSTKKGGNTSGFSLSLIYLLLLVALFVLPNSAEAQFNLIVCDPAGTNGLPPCTFEKLVELGVTLVNALIYISTFLATGAFAYAGFILLASGGNSGEKDRAKKMLSKVLMGYLWILGAWVLIYTISKVLLNQDFNKLL